MSSIWGRVNLQQIPLTAEDIEPMETALNHWGPDCKGYIVQGSAGMGRLTLYNTISSKHERLPAYKEELLLTANARIDNRDEICALLNIKNDEQEYPDGDLIIGLYRKYDKACVQYLVGDFAFAIWDEQQQHLFCARDHMGVKPFFYTLNANYVAFASEKKGLLHIPGFDKSINRDYLYNYILGSFSQPPGSTLYEKIKRLPAAHTLVLATGTGNVELTRYWEPDAGTEVVYNDDTEYFEGLKHHFDEAVKCRLRSEYKVGSELSGGLDSSGIAGAAHSFIGDGLTTFSNILPGDVTDEKMLRQSERKYIEAVTEYHKIRNKVFITEDMWDTALEEADFLLEVNDGLEMWNPTWQLGMKQAAKESDVRTILSGFPGDQMVTESGKLKYLYYLETGKYLQYWKSAKNRSDMMQRVMPFLPYNLAYGLHIAKNILTTDKKLRIAEGLVYIPMKYRVYRDDYEWKNRYCNETFRSLKHRQKARLSKPNIELRMEAETRQGIYFRTEPRFPMADTRLIQYYLSLPGHIKFGGDMNRYAFRMAVKDYLPEAVFTRTDKIGNMAPFLFNETKSLEKLKITEEIFERIKNKKNLPVKFKSEGTIKPFNISLLRWLELL